MCLLIWTVFSGERCGPWASCYHYVLTLSARCSGVKKKSFNEKHNFTVFIPKLRLRVTKFTIVRLLSLQMQNTKGGYYIGTLAFEMKLLKNDVRQCKRRTINDDRCKLVVIGHLGDSDDLKILKVDRQTDDSLTGNRKSSLKSAGQDFSKKKTTTITTPQSKL